MSEREKSRNVFQNLVRQIDDKSWPEFMRRIGFSYKKHNSDDGKFEMLYCWKIEMDRALSCWSMSETVLLLAKREVYSLEGHCEEIDTDSWNEDMKRNREIALVFYDVMRYYCDNGFWRTVIVRERLKLPQRVIVNLQTDYGDNFSEEKYQALDFWKKSKEQTSALTVEEIVANLKALDIVSERLLHISSVSRFRNRLNEVANEVTVVDQPINLKQAIEAVTLQILKKPADLPKVLDEYGQYNKRKDMTMVYESPRGDITIYELFDYAKRNAEKDAEFISPTLKPKHILRQGNNILVTGQAGIGKTTLTKMIVRLLLENEIPNVAAKYIIYIKIRKIDFERECNIIEFFQVYGGFLDPSSNEDIDMLSYQDFRELQKSSNVALIIDGLDEANTPKLKQDTPAWDPQTKTCPSIIIRNLMQGNILPNAKKLWTSRQRQAYEIHENVRPHTIVQILGLDRSAQEDVGKQLCTEEGWPLVQKYLEDHPDLQVICYVPVICIIAISSLHSSLVLENEDVVLSTMTDVLAYALDLYSRSDHLRDENLDDLSKVPILAWESFLNEKIIFDEQDLNKAGIREKTFEAFLITAVDKKTNFRLKLVIGDKNSSFSHLIWHEMFTGVEGMLFLTTAELKKHLPKLLESRWEIVAKLMYGLCHAPTTKRLKKILYKYTNKDTDASRELLKDFSKQQMRIFREYDSKQPEEKTQKLIQICTWVKETNSADFVEAARQELPDVVDINGELLPSDVRCISYVLPEGHAIQLGVTSNVRFIANSLLLLCSEIAEKRFKVLQLNLEGNDLNKINPNDICKCLDYVETLNIRKCRVNDSFLRSISETINKRTRPMSELNLSHNPVSIEGARYLSGCLEKISRLNIDSCEFDAVQFEIIAKVLRQTDHSISLHVGYTNINNRGAEALCSCLKNIRSMTMFYIGILDPGFRKFIQTIQALERPMDEITLTINKHTKNNLSKIDDDAKAEHVANCLKKVKTLKLNCWIKPLGALYLAIAITDLETPMELLDVSGNDFGDEGALHFTTCLRKVNKLVMENCAITEQGYRRFREAYGNTERKIATVVFGSIEGYSETVLKP